jgi:glycosyltransferase involved in cell wall biosynthesis
MLVFNLANQGTYWRAYHLGRHLARKGHSITLMATARQGRTGVRVSQQQGITLVESPDLFSGALRSGWDPWNILNRIYRLRGQSFDLIHGFESRPTVIYPALYLKKRRKIPLVLDWADWFGRGGSVEERPNPLVRAALRPVETYFEEHFRIQADRTTVICSLLEKKAISLGISQETILNLPNGADTENFQPLEQTEARRQIGIPENTFIIGFVGAIFQQDANLMAAAFDQLSDRLPQTRLLVAGYCPLDIRSFVKKPECVIQTGFLETPLLNAYLAASDIFWLPLCDSNANRGRFPLKLTDYLAIGRPIVATAVGDVQIVMKQNTIGLLCQPEFADLAEKTLTLYRDKELRRTFGEQARRTAEERFNWEVLAAQLEVLYQSVIH